MPIPLVPLIGAGASILGNLIGAGSTAKANRENREFTREMYATTRKDSLADWEMQNTYNSPLEQMNRLRDANLNPNLVYGTGTVGNNAGVPRAPQVEQYKHQPFMPDTTGIQQSLMSYYDVQLKEAQVNNLAKQSDVLTVEALLKTAQTAGTQASTAKTQTDTDVSKFGLGLQQSLRDNTLAMAEQQLKKMTAETAQTLTNTEVQVALKENTIRQSAAAIAKMRMEMETIPLERQRMRAAIAGMLSDNELKALDAKMAQSGLTKETPWYIKQVEQVLQKYFPESPNTKQKNLENMRNEQLFKAPHGPKTNYPPIWKK